MWCGRCHQAYSFHEAQILTISFEVVHRMKAYEDYIYGRWFYIFNDHQNLLQIAASTVPIIVRIGLYMQSHVFFKKHVNGTDNWAADFISRIHKSHKANAIDR